MASIPIGELLVDNGQITPEELEQAEAENKKTGEPITSVLAKLGFITENGLKNALELQYGVMYMNLSKREPEEELIAMLPEKMIREQQAVPVAQQGERLTVAMVDPNDSAALSEIQKTLSGKQVKPVVCLEEQFTKFVDRAFHVDEKTTNGNGSAPSDEHKPGSDATAETKDAPAADSKSDTLSDSKNESPAEAIIGTIVEPSSQSESKSEATARIESLESKPESAPLNRSESATESKSDSAPESKSDSAPESKSDSAPESKSDSAPAPISDSTPESKSDSAAEFKSESAPESKSDSASDSKTESPEIKSDTVPTDAASQSGAEAALALSRAETAIAKAEAGLAKAETAIAKAQSEPAQDTQEMKARPAPAETAAPAPEPEPAREEEHAPKSEADQLTETDLAKRAQEEAIVLLANQILGSAIKRHCSNIHITMGPRESLVKYRLNGRLMVDRKLPNTIVVALVARYKMMARLNLAERKEPQDGHIKVKSAAKEIVCLISVVPQDHGENVVIWIV
ncbi:MAG TPA: ATPase, T2SS/T4P/T4SS family [Drouetiella sp.]